MASCAVARRITWELAGNMVGEAPVSWSSSDQTRAGGSAFPGRGAGSPRAGDATGDEVAPAEVIVEERDDALLVCARVLAQRGRVARLGQIPELRAVAAGAVVELAPGLLDLARGDQQVRCAAAGDL